MSHRQHVATAVTMGGDTKPIIRGQHWRGGMDWAILIHDVDQDLDAWANAPATLVDAGYSVLAIDLPGHGLSDEPWHFPEIARSVQTAMSFAKNAGAKRCFLLVAGSISVPSMIAASDLIQAVVAFSPEASDDELRALEEVHVPTLVLAGSADAKTAEQARRVFHDKAGWAVLSIFGAAENGTALLTGPWSSRVREQILLFLRDYRSPNDPANI
jgi:pimeloyl-ACP methyl ester carboxylesterase